MKPLSFKKSCQRDPIQASNKQTKNNISLESKSRSEEQGNKLKVVTHMRQSRGRWTQRAAEAEKG